MLGAVPMVDDLAQQINHVRDATRRLLAGLAELSDADVRRLSLCPGWTVGHVLTHIARNADALRRSVAGARRGEVVAPYQSRQVRDADIEAGAARPMAELRADISATAQALDDAWSSLDAAAWDRDMPHPRFGPLPIRQTPQLRWAEVEIHRVDLAGGYRPSDWPAPFVAQCIEQVADGIPGRLPAVAAVDVEASDTAQRWSFGREGNARTTVRGPSWAIAAWMLGRGAAAEGELSVTDGKLPVLAALG